MGVVAISETAGSLGNEIGRRLAESLGWAFADREIIAKAADRFGQDLTELRHGVEEKPSLWERFTDSHRRYRAFVEATVFEMAAQDNVVLAGLMSTLALREVRHVLRIRTTAPEQDRARRLEYQHGLTNEAALETVRHTDRERAARVKFLYHLDVDDPLLYDLVLNTERFTADQGARLLREFLGEERYRPSEGSLAALTDLNVVAQARAMFMAHPRLSQHQLFVSAHRGEVSLSGSVATDEERQTAESLLAGIPGVRKVANEVAIPPAGAITYRGT